MTETTYIVYKGDGDARRYIFRASNGGFYRTSDLSVAYQFNTLDSAQLAMQEGDSICTITHTYNFQ